MSSFKYMYIIVTYLVEGKFRETNKRLANDLCVYILYIYRLDIIMLYTNETNPFVTIYVIYMQI